MKKTLFAGMAFLCFSTVATAQPQCAPHDVVLISLAERFGESRQAMALVEPSGNVMEVWANLETGTWTLTATSPGGPTCFVAGGQAYQAIAEALPPMGEDM